MEEKTIVKAMGYVDQEQAMEIVKEISRLRKEGKTCVAVDMSEVENLNSSAIGLFIYTWKTVSKQSLMILNPSKHAKQLLEETNLHRIFRIVYEPEKD